MAKSIGTRIKEARTGAGLTQEQLARKVKNCSANDISKAEHNEKKLTQEQLKQIAKATGVTQKSLLEASGSSTTSSSATGSTMKVTATERRLVEAYRKADSDTKKKAMKLLKGESSVVGDLLEGVLDDLLGK